jgi:hypothetical protein
VSGKEKLFFRVEFLDNTLQDLTALVLLLLDIIFDFVYD